MADVLITGASTGIGEATALRLGGRGHRVFAGVRRPADGRRLTAVAGGDHLTPVALDVTDDAGVAAALAEVSDATGGRLDGVVNNAGIAVGGPLEFLPLEDFRRQLEVNVTGLLAVTQSALPLLRRAQGRVVLIGSMSGRVAVPMTGAYAASKFAVEALADALRLELSPWGLGVSLVQPGAVRTPIWDKGREQVASMADRFPPDALELYADGIEGVAAGIERQEEDGIAPIEVAAAVERALFAARPRTRVAVGSDAKVAVALARVLPDRLKDVLIDRFVRP
jgi:NAD(P)-dependent dehydrogenase (short-subunit alcohol dehydrogenase family)